jgi:hypothetical protein
MKHKLSLALAFAMPLLFGCSSPSITRINDLGSVDVASRETRHYRLSRGRECRLTLTPLANDEVLVEAVVLVADTQGNTKLIARPRTQTRFGQKVILPIGNGNVAVTPRRI